ncbi:MAG TPA: PIN domain-containing protein [Aurantimonas coralicida]|uniref:PIN domain-containing protein n=2 Tax=root TaxID=1 RepID=A0A9C9TJ68_9HYPH|nr:PIN domain-containing protein [Aurantimonas coralicida]HEU03330.1 PIN domain-containing protein [Aurantimonas coralicida]
MTTRIGVDTNVLLRLFLTDDSDQFEASKKFFAASSKGQAIFVNQLVLVEFAWTLRSRYRLSADQILNVIEQISQRADVEIENAALVGSALDMAREGVGFSDALITARNTHHGCENTVTFDKRAAKVIPSMKLLS